VKKVKKEYKHLSVTKEIRTTVKGGLSQMPKIQLSGKDVIKSGFNVGGGMFVLFEKKKITIVPYVVGPKHPALQGVKH
jgi:hypothetical protein